MEVKLPKDYREIARDFKEGPDFGIHGIKKSNLEAALNDFNNKPALVGHYFAINDKAKNMSDKDFYESLYGSIGTALDFSAKLEKIEDNKAVFGGLPCLIIGINNGKNPRIIKCDNNAFYTKFYNKKGGAIITFEVGHDFIDLAVDLRIVAINDKELKKYNQDLEKYLLAQKGNFSEISGTYLILDKLIKNLMSKIHKEIISYKLHKIK